jgi:hypothetical protein
VLNHDHQITQFVGMLSDITDRHAEDEQVQGSLEVKQYSVPGLVLASPPVPEVL